MTFGERLRSVVDDRGPLCVGIDPHASLLHAWGLPDDASGVERFGRTVVDALGDRVAVFKPQSAFFERHGSTGIAALERLLSDIRSTGALSLLDVKRGDIGSTVQAYADAYLRPSSPLFADAITATPFLGFDSLGPLYDLAAQHDCGVFVLALTSNPEGPQVQTARRPDGRTVARAILHDIAVRNAGATPMGSVGAVVAANLEGADEDFAALNGPILAPGLGAQGGTPEHLRRIFGAALPNVLPSSSREILAAGPSPDGLREAAARALPG